MTVRLLLIRHAAHIHLNRCLSGRLERVPLSAEGREQAARLGKALASEPIDRIVASPLDRTRETAAAIAGARPEAISVELDEALIELDMGQWTGRSLDGFADDPAWRAWNENRGIARIPGGETMAEAAVRIIDCLERLARGRDGETIVVVSHSDMIRGAVAAVIGLPLQLMLRFDIDPATVTRVDWGDWGTRLISLNERVGAWQR